ncbi:hypothetical protein D9757_005524 [Collybiopsis confluens]|uniref:Uncharacterized protein n=1 Tax=Collybiopsis confluens TaxID=2823264 RepID=A0A8H5HM75_9AGAR|nr:hypothetical protein D9757_005524 [Collybiopsis confluens]
MPFHIPFVQSSPRPRRSFGRLRSFHLIQPEVEKPFASPPPSPPPLEIQLAPVERFKHPPKRKSFAERASRQFHVRAVDGIIPVPPIFYFGLAVLCSVIFVLTIPSVFHGVNAQESIFKPILDDAAQNNPGLVLLGENVDIDVDEPAVTIRWSIVACGEEFILPGSRGIHGSTLCGLPNFALQIFVDGDPEAAGVYDPTLIPYNTSGQRRKIQNLVQFDSDHVLDVHNDRLYPFDTYFLSSTLRAESQNKSVPFSRLATLDITSAFLVDTVDVESYGTDINGTSTPSRDIDMNIKRPVETRIIAFLLFASSWFLAHICIGNVIIARRTRDTRPIFKMLVMNGATVVGLPQLRNSMPDGPDLDGVVIDAIGFFPQMIIAGFTLVILLLTIYAREIDRVDRLNLLGPPQYTPRDPSFSRRISNTHSSNNSSYIKSPYYPPPPRIPSSSSTDIAKYNMHRMTKHLKGEFVFPPVQKLSTWEEESSPRLPAHRRFKTDATSPSGARLLV